MLPPHTPLDLCCFSLCCLASANATLRRFASLRFCVSSWKYDAGTDFDIRLSNYIIQIRAMQFFVKFSRKNSTTIVIPSVGGAKRMRGWPVKPTKAYKQRYKTKYVQLPDLLLKPEMAAMMVPIKKFRGSMQIHPADHWWMASTEAYRIRTARHPGASTQKTAGTSPQTVSKATP